MRDVSFAGGCRRDADTRRKSRARSGGDSSAADARTYFLIAILTPLAAIATFSPCVVDTASITTPF